MVAGDLTSFAWQCFLIKSRPFPLLKYASKINYTELDRIFSLKLIVPMTSITDFLFSLYPSSFYSSERPQLVIAAEFVSCIVHLADGQEDNALGSLSIFNIIVWFIYLDRYLNICILISSASLLGISSCFCYWMLALTL